MAYIPRTEFATALFQVAKERGIKPEAVLETIKLAIIAAYRREIREQGKTIPEEGKFEVEINSQSGETRIFEVRGKKRQDVTPPGFGRIAAQTAKQVILQKIREAEKTAILEEYSQKIGTLISGVILRFDGPNIIVDIGKTEAIMPPQEQVKSEEYKPNQRLTFYVKETKEGPRGQQIVVSRAAKELVEALFKREVPEVFSGVVKIVAVAREEGVRTKIAVSSSQSGVDPVGSCVGQKGVRVQRVIDELNGEKIDIIQYNKEPEKFITASLSPAEGINIKLDKKRKIAKVTVPHDQLSLAIGKGGENVRLATKLTGYKIDVVGERKIKPAEATPAETIESLDKNSSNQKAQKGKEPKSSMVPEEK